MNDLSSNMSHMASQKFPLQGLREQPSSRATKPRLEQRDAHRAARLQGAPAAAHRVHRQRSQIAVSNKSPKSKVSASRV